MDVSRNNALTIALLGPPRVLRGESVLWEGRLDRPLALLSYLVAHPGPRQRGEIAALLWPEKDSRAARANLSTALYNVESRLGVSGLFESTAQTIGWKSSGGWKTASLSWEVEPVDLRRYLRDDPPSGCASLHPPDRCPQCLERIGSLKEIGLRTFLEGCSFHSLRGFGEWAGRLRTTLALRQKALERQLSLLSPVFPPPPVPTHREIRQTTFLSILLTGFSENDPEEVVELREAFQERIDPLVEDLGGELRAGTGGSLHGIFGFFKSLEDPTRRAVLAARGIRGLFRSDPRFRSGEIRLAVHTGEGLADLTSGDPDPVGDRVREADRIAWQALPGEILATWETVRIIDRFFQVGRWRSFQEDQDNKGSPLFVIGDEIPPGQYPEASLVGRKEEKSRMERLLREVWEFGGLRTLWITGEAGIGKSALLGEFVRLFKNMPGGGGVRQIFCLSGDLASPYSPVIRFLRSHVGIEDRTSPREARYRVERYLLSTGQLLGENIPLLLHLLCGEGSWSEEIVHISPEHLRRRFDSLILSILSFRSQSPFLLAVEDLHWMDQTTADLLKKSLVALRGSPALFILTARDEGTFRKMGLPPPDEILSLSALSRGESREMIERLAPGAFSPSALKAGIDRGGGIPLYLRELVLSGALSGESAGIPSGLKELLSARIGSLGESRTMAKVAACFGQSVDWPLLMRATERYADLPSGGHIANSWLFELQDHKILELESSFPDPVYRFRHALLREALLNSLPGSVKREIHRVLAGVLREEFSSRVSRQPEILGGHLVKAGLSSEAVEFFINAGDRSAALGAYRSALDHFETALSLLEDLPSSPDVEIRILRLLLHMVRIANVVSGYGSPESERLGQKATDLVRKHPGSLLEDKLSHILVGIGSGNYGPVWTLARLDSLSHVGRDVGSRLWAACVRGTAFFWKGELGRAHSELSGIREEVVRYRWEEDAAFADLTEFPPVLLHSYLGFVCQLQGKIRECQEVFKAGEGLEDLRLPRSRVFWGVFSTYTRWMAQDVEGVRTLASEMAALAENSELRMWEELLRLALLWCDPSLENLQEAEERLAAIREMLPGVSPIFFSLTAELALKAGQWEKTLEVARFGREEGERSGTRVFDPFFHLLEGQALLCQGSEKNREGAREHFLTAKDEAVKTGALWHGLMAEVELASMGYLDRKSLASLLGELAGGEELPLVVAARTLLATEEFGTRRGRRKR